MTKKALTKPVEATDVISGVFVTRRDLLHGVKAVVAGSGFTVEESDLLVSLYGARVLDWDDLEHDKDGFVAFHQLERFVVYNPSLLSRRIRKLADAKPPLVEVANADLAAGQHFNSKRVRITKEGAKRIEPVWKRFQQMSAKLLAAIPQHLLKAHYEVNQRISAEIRKRRSGLSDLLLGDQ
jgi:hypothetical protein